MLHQAAVESTKYINYEALLHLNVFILCFTPLLHDISPHSLHFLNPTMSL